MWLIRGGILKNTYALDAIYFHWGANGMVGSEHTIDGQTFPLEVNERSLLHGTTQGRLHSTTVWPRSSASRYNVDTLITRSIVTMETH